MLGSPPVALEMRAPDVTVVPIEQIRRPDTNAPKAFSSETYQELADIGSEVDSLTTSGPRAGWTGRRITCSAGDDDLCRHQRDRAQHYCRAWARSAEMTSVRDLPKDDERAVLEMVTRFFRERAPPSGRLEAAGGEVTLPPPLYGQFACLDIFGLAVAGAPEALGLTPLVSSLVAERAGETSLPARGWMS